LSLLLLLLLLLLLMATCCSPFRPWTSVGVFCLFASVANLITATSLPFFFVNPFDPNNHMGVFAYCDESIQTNCVPIATDCSVNVGLFSGLQLMMDNTCDSFNAMRATLLIGIVGLGCNVIGSIGMWASNKTGERRLQQIHLFSALFSICSLISSISVFSATFIDMTDSWGVSYWMTVSSTLAAIIGNGCYYKGCKSEGDASTASSTSATAYAVMHETPSIPYPSAHSAYWTVNQNGQYVAQQQAPLPPPIQPYFQHPRYHS